MAILAKTPTPLKVSVLTATKTTPRVRTKANVKAAAAASPKLPKPKTIAKKAVGAAKKTKAMSANTKVASEVHPAILPISNEHRRHYIELAAFYIAERRGFNGGNTLEDWLKAEAEIDNLLQQGKINR